MKKIKFNIYLLLILGLAACNSTTSDKTNDIYKASYGNGTNTINLATGSPGELGLLKELAMNYPAINDVKINWIKAGSGKSLQLLKEKKVDIVLVHAPKAEENAIKEGWVKERGLIGSNAFIIVGPKNDPANINSAKNAIEAFTKIANIKAIFLSRGDNSGTNKKELHIWKQANIQPKGEWYLITNDFMMATLKKANKTKGYFMVDNSTWFAGKENLNNLKVLFKGDPNLINIYHFLISSEVPKDSYTYKFANYIISEKGQEIIKNYGIKDYGMPLYNNAANK